MTKLPFDTRPMVFPITTEVDAAVDLIEDWSGGQFYVYETPEPYYTKEYERNYEAAYLAIRHASARLSDWGRSVAERILAETPAVMERCTELLEQDRRMSRKIARYANKDTRPGYVYLLQSPTSAYKIGRTTDPDNRLKTFGILLPFEVEYICVIKTGDMYALEWELHAHFGQKRINGEWFALTPEDVEYIKGLAE